MHQNLMPKLIFLKHSFPVINRCFFEFPLHVNQNNSFTHIINNTFKKSLLLSNFEIQYTIILSNVQPSVSANAILLSLLLLPPPPPPPISIILSTTAALLSFISGFHHFRHQPFHPAVHPPTSTPISLLPPLSTSTHSYFIKFFINYFLPALHHPYLRFFHPLPFHFSLLFINLFIPFNSVPHSLLTVSLSFILLLFQLQ